MESVVLFSLSLSLFYTFISSSHQGPSLAIKFASPSFFHPFAFQTPFSFPSLPHSPSQPASPGPLQFVSTRKFPSDSAKIYGVHVPGRDPRGDRQEGRRRNGRRRRLRTCSGSLNPFFFFVFVVFRLFSFSPQRRRLRDSKLEPVPFAVLFQRAFERGCWVPFLSAMCVWSTIS